MDQISPPMRIVLVVAILFAAAWFTVLKPSDETAAEPAPAPTAVPAASNPNGPTAQTGLGRAAQSARGAAQTQEQADAASSAASSAAGTESSATPDTSAAAGAGTSTAGSGTSAAAAPDTSAAATDPSAAAADPSAAGAAAQTPAQVVAEKTGLPQRIAGALAGRQVVVLLFWDRAGSDDRAVRRAVRGLGMPGKVLVQVAPVAKVSRYAAITQGVDLSRSPSVVVVDRRLKAQLLSGFVARDTIRQAIADARR